MASRGKNELTDKESRFVAEYLVDMNQTRAARAAGYKQPESAGPQLMKRPRIARIIGYKKADQIERLELRADTVLRELYYMATRTADDFRDPDTGEWTTSIDKMSQRAKHCIEGFEVEESYDKDGGRSVKTKVKLTNKVSSIDMAMKHLGQYLKDNQQRGEQKLTIDLSNLMQDKKDAPNEVEQRIIDVKSIPIEQPKYGLRELIDEGGDVD